MIMFWLAGSFFHKRGNCMALQEFNDPVKSRDDLDKSIPAE